MGKILFIVFIINIISSSIFCHEPNLDSSSHSPIKKYPEHLAWIAENPYQIDPNYHDYQLSFTMGKALYGLSEEERALKREEIKQTSKKVFFKLYDEQGSRIPHITHRSWFTSTKTPKEPSIKRLNLYLQSLKKLPSDWEHNFWCIDPTQIPETIKILQGSGIPIKIRKLEEISETMKAKHVIEAYYDHNQFCLASDIIRHNIVYLFGGVYSDLGTNFVEDLTPYVNAYDLIFPTNSQFIDQSFFAYKKHEPIIKSYLEILDNLYKLPKKIKAVTRNPRENQGWHSPPMLMVVVDKFSKKGDRFLFVPEGDKSLMWVDHGNTWCSINDPFGNISITQSTLDILSVSPIIEGSKPTTSDKLLYKIKGEPFLRESPNDWNENVRNTLITCLHNKHPYPSIPTLQSMMNEKLHQLLTINLYGKIIKPPSIWDENERNAFIVQANKFFSCYSISSLQSLTNAGIYAILTLLWSDKDRNTLIVYAHDKYPQYSIDHLQGISNESLYEILTKGS